MAFKIIETDVDGRPSTFIEEAYDDEIAQLFLDADKEAGQEVDVIYTICQSTGDDIELWRQDWMIQRLSDD